MEFDYDPQKSATNKTKHGIDFEEAKLVWQDIDVMLLASAYSAENRFLAIGYTYKKLWTVIFALRGDKIRIISARRSRESEAAYYEKHKNT
jgi:uncharacterized DUF497 family protein